MNPPRVSPQDQAHAIAEWVLHTREGNQAGSPGLNWLRQPDDYSDREWILAIAQQYRQLVAMEERRSRNAAGDSVPVRTRDARAG